jgi:hypothetical protein
MTMDTTRSYTYDVNELLLEIDQLRGQIQDPSLRQSTLNGKYQTSRLMVKQLQTELKREHFENVCPPPS